ncbi:MAG: hypothetical protein HY070_05985 [Chloroflexi bacterium]|nr:hypothetical protein [Chloroflexota bacterium]
MKQVLIALSILALLALCICAMVFVAVLPSLGDRLSQARQPAAATATTARGQNPTALPTVAPAANVTSAPRTGPSPTPPAKTFTNLFPQQLVFYLNTDSATQINQVSLIIQLDGQSSSLRFLPEFTPSKKISVAYEYNLQQNYLPPGVTGQFWWVLKDVDGKETPTAKESFRVDEPVIQWKKISNSKIAIYWYSGEQTFGQQVFDRAVQSLALLEKDTGVTVDRQVQIFLYGNRNDFLNALGPNVAGFEGGRTHPEFGVVLIDAGPRTINFAKEATTHEMTHVIMHAKISGALGEFSFPHWLDEGLAMYYETVPGPLNPQFSLPLKKAIDENTLLSLRSMAGRFPIDQVDLGYAESFSAVDYIYRKFGAPKMQALLLAIKVGGDFDELLQKTIGLNTDQLENEWRKEIGAKPRVIPTATPVGKGPTPFPTFSLSTDPTATPAK